MRKRRINQPLPQVTETLRAALTPSKAAWLFAQKSTVPWILNPALAVDRVLRFNYLDADD